MNGRRIFGAFTIAAALFAFWPAVVGSWLRVSALRDGVAQREDLLTQRQDILANLAEVSAQYQQQISETSGRNLLAIVPVTKDVAELVSALEGMAARSGVVLNEIQVGEGVVSRDAVAETLTINIEMTGSYGALRTFLDAMEREIRLLNVTDISISGDSVAGLSFSVAAEAYFIE